MSIDFGEHRNYEEPRIPLVILQRLSRYAERFRHMYMEIALREGRKKHGTLHETGGHPVPHAKISNDLQSIRSGFESTRDFCYRWKDLDPSVKECLKTCEEIWVMIQTVHQIQPL